MREYRSKGLPPCQAVLFPTEALASDEECYNYIYETIRAIREGRGTLRDLDGIRQVSEIMRLRHQRRRIAAMLEGPVMRRLRRLRVRLGDFKVWLRREYVARTTARRLGA